jgi:hypothetical protein
MILRSRRANARDDLVRVAAPGCLALVVVVAVPRAVRRRDDGLEPHTAAGPGKQANWHGRSQGVQIAQRAARAAGKRRQHDHSPLSADEIPHGGAIAVDCTSEFDWIGGDESDEQRGEIRGTTPLNYGVRRTALGCDETSRDKNECERKHRERFHGVCYDAHVAIVSRGYEETVTAPRVRAHLIQQLSWTS